MTTMCPLCNAHIANVGRTAKGNIPLVICPNLDKLTFRGGPDDDRLGEWLARLRHPTARGDRRMNRALATLLESTGRIGTWEAQQAVNGMLDALDSRPQPPSSPPPPPSPHLSVVRSGTPSTDGAPQ